MPVPQLVHEEMNPPANFLQEFRLIRPFSASQNLTHGGCDVMGSDGDKA